MKKKEYEENDEGFTQYYKIGPLIGQGAFGMVFSCIDIRDSTPLAVKVLK